MAGKLASGGGKGGYSANAEPNVIPFIDIMLVLLIIFMVAAPIPTVDIRVDLPPPVRQPPSDNPNKPTRVNIAEENGVTVIYIDGEVTSIDEIGDKTLQRALANSPTIAPIDIFAQARILVRADQDTAYGNVIGVMSRLQEEKFVNVGIVAERAELQ